MNEIIKELKELLFEATKRNSCNGLLFSGGLDTSILAVINPKVVGVTVSLGSKGRDIYYSKLLAGLLNIEYFHKKVEVDEALMCIPEVIKILKSFDPAIPNDLVVYFGLRLAKELGIGKIATGDGSDELFAGYSFMKSLDDLESYIQRISTNMRFNSNEIGNFFGIGIIQPFLDKRVIDFSLRIPVRLKIKEENNKQWGKWILRKAFEDILPKEIVWQSKRPLEYGSGMTELRETISSKISNDEFEEKQRLYPVKFLNKEHLYYYEIYRKWVGEIPQPSHTEKICPGCKAGIKNNHCKVCGYVLDWRQK
jgi:asparagine synthase (glutamine-hydrolysing)